MAKFTAPKPKAKLDENIETFLGADLSNGSNNVAKNRSPSCPNMIRSEVGKVEQRGGIELVKFFGTQGSETCTITTGATAGDTVTIDGVIFTASISGADLIFE